MTTAITGPNRFTNLQPLEPREKTDLPIFQGFVPQNTAQQYKTIHRTSTVSEGDWRLSTHATCWYYIQLMRADSSDFGLLVEQSSPKWEIPCPGRPWTIVQNLMPLALCTPEKSVTVQTHKITNKQTNKQ